MAAPNIVGVTTIVGITTFVNLSTTNATTIVSNPASSDKVFKINTIIVSNIDGSSTANITVKIHNASAGAGTSVALANTIDVVADSTLVVLDKASSFYLEEDRSITATASAANDLSVVCSYEEISD
jgi:hypothetical protein